MRKGGRCFEVRLGGVTHSVTVDRSASVRELRAAAALATGEPASELTLLCRGQRLVDDTAVADALPDGRERLLAIAQPPPMRRRLTLRDLCGGCVHGVEPEDGCTVSEMCRVAEQSLGVEPNANGALFSRHVGQLLRPELLLSDYALPNESEVFLISRSAVEAEANGDRAADPIAAAASVGGPDPPRRAVDAPMCPPPPPPTPPPPPGVPATLRTGLRTLQRPSGRRSLPLASGAAAHDDLFEERCAALVEQLALALPSVAGKAAAGSAAPPAVEHTPAAEAKPTKRRSSARRRGRVDPDGCSSDMRPPSAAPAAMTAPMRKPPACLECGRRLPTLTAFVQNACDCGGLFCAAHLCAHECSFDHRARQRQQIAAANPKLEARKMEPL
ncbi:hypothetical protein EMIHUDRAFT_121170 [Emiliania huxleyi CCMP1516]|uniref:Ubiquitin-like domain-containing protein n=2 Tax=Emiliania huxleyi TaxID=2903 RepID=A0A0D3I6H2_EMIH1|nr:hypothetical protein EMIHUDRAFT_121170 [Emiliania huxleyi CCMP1516]EOD06857.1 hypothetical protein EMIHUDRAFT_121170 [Emiliania huxleyi CCMP1516]|eukprot:XP_005759286.1 hypothetical protein EMIHUDRAFT_121170 [Emiliania huxleyi CCMP1516]